MERNKESRSRSSTKTLYNVSTSRALVTGVLNYGENAVNEIVCLRESSKSDRNYLTLITKQ